MATTTSATTAATVEKMSSMNLGDLKTNVDGLGSNMNETTASTTVASGLKTVESAVPHAALDGAFEGPGSKMKETAASNYVANLPVEKLEELLAAKKAAAKKAEASTMMQLNPAKLAVEILPLESQPHKHTPQMGLNESLDREVGGADVIFSTPSRSKVTLHPTTADSPRCSPRRSPRQKSPAPTKPSYHRRSIAKVRRAQEGELPSDFPTGPWKDANEGYQEIGNYTRDPTRGGGSWDIRWCGFKPGTSKQGPNKTIMCSKYLKPSSGGGEAIRNTTTHRTTLKKCSCQRPTCFGLPCVHMLRVYLKLE